MDLAIVANEPAPYRMAVVRRLTVELEGVRTHAFFTSDPKKLSQSWDGDIALGTNSTFFPNYATSPGNRSYRRQIKLYRAVRDKLIEHNVRLVLLHGYNDLTRYLILRWCNRNNVLVALTSDSNIFKEGTLTTIKAMAKRVYVRHIIKRLDGILPCGTAGQAYHRAYMDHDLPSIIFPFEPDYSAFEIAKEQVEEHLRSHALDTNKRYALFCGRFIRRKRIDLALKAFTKIAPDREDWDLIIVGEGPEKKKLQASVPTEVAGRVHWVGFAQRETLAKWYLASDLMIVPSDFEPWGLVVNEAAAAGLAIIATDVTGAAIDLIHEDINGYLFPPRDGEALTRVFRMATEPERIDRLKEGSGRILAHWRSSKDCVEAVRELIDRLGLV